MKDLKNLLIYGGGAALVIAVLSRLATAEILPANLMVATAVLLVIVLPVVLAILLARREHAQAGDESRPDHK